MGICTVFHNPVKEERIGCIGIREWEKKQGSEEIIKKRNNEEEDRR